MDDRAPDASPRVTDPLREQLQAALGGEYTIEQELGGGGMSRVFVALERLQNPHIVPLHSAGDRKAGGCETKGRPVGRCPTTH